MKKTVLLVFIHGFKGGDDTFATFPDHLRQLVSDAIPNAEVVSITYPQYETRGILSECVAGFREWLQNKIIDLEVEAKSPSPMIEPSVRTILVGHSMGGIVAAEALLGIASEQEVPSATDTSRDDEDGDKAAEKHTASEDVGADDPRTSSSIMFPSIYGILAFDTPYLGIHPGVVAHGAESHYNTASKAFNAYTEATKFFGNVSSSSSQQAASNATKAGAEALAKSGSSWGSYALYAGGIASLAIAGGAAWMNRDQIATGWNWATSHLEFVGCLARGADLAKRVERVTALGSERNIGFVDFYTQLGAMKGTTEYADKLLGEERTFCVVPKEAKETTEHGPSPNKRRKSGTSTADGRKGTWVPCVNTKVDSEIAAHRSMFTSLKNSNYDVMSHQAKDFVIKWVDVDWFTDSEVSTDTKTTDEPLEA